MLRHCSSKSNKGFTLAEMLIVVAIIAVLVAVAIPVFSGELAKSREAVCVANQRALKAAVSYDYMSSYDHPGAAIVSGAKEMGLTATAADDAVSASFSAGGLCPGGGDYTVTINGNSVSVTCSVHNTKAPTPTELFADANTLGTLKSIIADRGSSSGQVKQPTEELIKALTDAGLSPDALGMATWAYLSDNGNTSYGRKLYWTTSEIPNSPTKEKVAAMSYTLTTGHFVVKYVDVQNGQIIKEYNDNGCVLNPVVADQTYEKAMEVYNKNKKY